MSTSLTPEHATQIQHLFEQVIDLAPDERTAYLNLVCSDAPDLRREVDALLSAYGCAGIVLHRFDHPVPEEPDRFVGQTVSHYRILEKLGGGMGVVYKARDTRLDRTVALKFLPPYLSTDEETKRRFIHEARAASALEHFNICTIYEIVDSREQIDETKPVPEEPGNGRLFIAMAYYEGETLKTKITRGPLPVDEALDYTVQIARGLARAHEAGIVHRDVKPTNVMVKRPGPTEAGNGVVKIVDFGLAKMADVHLARTGTTLGIVAYMSPEQAFGEPVDARTDLWSLGVVLYELLTGERPFMGDYREAIIYAIRHDKPTSLTVLRPETPDALEHVVTKALAKNPDARYQTAEELLDDLNAL